MSRIGGSVIAVLLLLLCLPHLKLCDLAVSETASVSPGRFSLNLGASDQDVRRQHNFSMVLTGTRGDLLFQINLSAPKYLIQTYVPPEFGGLIPGNTTNIWTSVTNDYRNVQVQKLRYNDTIAPLWYRIDVRNQTGDPYSPNLISKGTHYVRVLDIQAPQICGRYFFKIFTQSSTYDTPSSIGSGNFPTVVVSSSLNPAYISGRLLACQRGYDYYYYVGRPISASGKVTVEGITDLGATVKGMAYVNSSAQGNYTIYGLEAGIYNVTASAEGYPPVKLSRQVNVRPSQSLEGIDIYLCRGANITGIVWSKCELGPIRWGNLTFLDPFSPKAYKATVDGYAVSSLLVNQSIISGIPFATLVLNVNSTEVSADSLLPPGFDAVLTTGEVTPIDPSTFTLATQVACGYQTYPSLYQRWVTVPRPFKTVLSKVDGQSVVNVTGITDPDEANFNFSVWFSEYDGHIPQDGAGYVSGIGYGDYMIRSFVNQYVQLEEYRVGVFNETSSVLLRIDLHRTGKIVTTVHLKDVEGGAAAPSDRDHVLVADVYDQTGTLWGTNLTLVPKGSSQTQVVVTGFALHQYLVNQPANPLLPMAVREFLKGSVEPPDYGLLPGTYFVKVTMDGYLQRFVTPATTHGCDSVTQTSFEVYKGGRINLTLRSVNWQQPSVPVTWNNPSKNITVLIYDKSGQAYGYMLLAQTPNSFTASGTYGGVDWYDLTRTLLPYITGARDQALQPQEYLLKVYTTGYLPSETVEVVIPGGGPGVGVGTADLQIDLLVGGTLILDICFKTERLFSPLPEFQLRDDSRTPVRIEVYDADGLLVGASTGYVPMGATELSCPWTITDSGMIQTPFLNVTGLDRYYGTFTVRWANYFHTTDGILQSDRGLPPGQLSVKVYVPRYEQTEPSTATLTPQGKRTLSIVMERMAHLKGTVYYYNIFGLIAPLSWSSVSLIGPNLYFTPTLDGKYEIWAPEGSYSVTAGHVGFESVTKSLYLSPASEAEIDFHMKDYAHAIPEIMPGQIHLVLLVLSTFTLLLVQIQREHKNQAYKTGRQRTQENNRYMR